MIVPMCTGLAGFTVFLLAGGGLFWAVVIFLVAIMPDEDARQSAHSVGAQ